MATGEADHEGVQMLAKFRAFEEGRAILNRIRGRGETSLDLDVVAVIVCELVRLVRSLGSGATLLLLHVTRGGEGVDQVPKLIASAVDPEVVLCTGHRWGRATDRTRERLQVARDGPCLGGLGIVGGSSGGRVGDGGCGVGVRRPRREGETVAHLRVPACAVVEQVVLAVAAQTGLGATRLLEGDEESVVLLSALEPLVVRLGDGWGRDSAKRTGELLVVPWDDCRGGRDCRLRLNFREARGGGDDRRGGVGFGDLCDPGATVAELIIPPTFPVVKRPVLAVHAQARLGATGPVKGDGEGVVHLTALVPFAVRNRLSAIVHLFVILDS